MAGIPAFRILGLQSLGYTHDFAGVSLVRPVPGNSCGTAAVMFNFCIIITLYNI